MHVYSTVHISGDPVGAKQVRMHSLRGRGTGTSIPAGTPETTRSVLLQSADSEARVINALLCGSSEDTLDTMN